MSAFKAVGWLMLLLAVGSTSRVSSGCCVLFGPLSVLLEVSAYLRFSSNGEPKGGVIEARRQACRQAGLLE